MCVHCIHCTSSGVTAHCKCWRPLKALSNLSHKITQSNEAGARSEVWLQLLNWEGPNDTSVLPKFFTGFLPQRLRMIVNLES